MSDKAQKEPQTWHKSIYIDEVQNNQDRFQKFMTFTYSSTKASALMLLAAVVALAVANTGLYGDFLGFWNTEVGFVVGDRYAGMSLAHIINDIFMAVFFLLVGLEIKYEMTAGDLTNFRQALLPIIAAFGGVLAPIAIYAAFNGGFPDTQRDGWGIPTATDIAFALGVLSLLGNRVPNGVRVFLSTLAVADDIIAIIVIAMFYGHSPSFVWLACVVAVVLVLVAMNRMHVYSLLPYLLVGVVLWYCVFMSGVHSTIAGVLLAFTIPAGSRINLRQFIGWSAYEAKRAGESYNPDVHVSAQGEYIETVSNLSHVARQVVPPATRLEHKLYPWVYFGILPLFALTNADVSLLGSGVMELVDNPVFSGVPRPSGWEAPGHPAVQLRRRQTGRLKAARKHRLDPHGGRRPSGGRGLHHGHLRCEPGVPGCRSCGQREAGHPFGLRNRRGGGLHLPRCQGQGRTAPRYRVPYHQPRLHGSPDGGRRSGRAQQRAA